MNSNDFWAGHFLPDLSEVLQKQFEQIEEMNRKMVESLFQVQEVFKPLSEALSFALPKYLDFELSTCFSRSFVAIRKMGEAQFVFCLCTRYHYSCLSRIAPHQTQTQNPKQPNRFDRF